MTAATDLVVLRDATGVHVALRQINVASGTGTVILQSIDLPSGTYDQIVLRLSYVITASSTRRRAARSRRRSIF